MPPSPALIVENLQTGFFTKGGVVRAVDGVSYTLERGKTLGVVGESGCGKSVTAYSILGLLAHPGRVISGSARVGDVDLLSLSEPELRKFRGKRVAMIFQEPMTALNPVMTVGAQICEQVQLHEKVSRHEARRRALDLLEMVGIPSPTTRLDAYPHQLSGGMRQRAMIAMALSCEPDILIADEPTTALDVTIQAQILDLLQALQERMGMAIQFITHNLGVISEIADRVVVMYAGRIIEEAPADDLFAHPHHPYTVGLLASIPRIDRDQPSLQAIHGTVPDLRRLPPGCRFQNRCHRVQNRCRESDPALLPSPHQATHRVACYFPMERSHASV